MNHSSPLLPWDDPPLGIVGGVDLAHLQQLADRMVGTPLRSSDGGFPPLVIGLCGTLGVGKTRLVQEICRAAGVDVTEVTSPTFTLVQTYRTPAGPLHHLDAYRIADADEFWQLGMEDVWWEPGCRTLVEWADRVAEEMPAETVWVRMTVDEGGASAEPPRRLEFWCSDPMRRHWAQRVIGL